MSVSGVYGKRPRHRRVKTGDKCGILAKEKAPDGPRRQLDRFTMKTVKPRRFYARAREPGQRRSGGGRRREKRLHLERFRLKSRPLWPSASREERENPNAAGGKHAGRLAGSFRKTPSR